MRVPHWQAFEMEHLMHSRSALLPVLTYLFRRLEKRFDGAPCAVLNAANCGGSMVNGHYPDQPDLDFTANGSTPASTTFWGVTPGTTDGSSTHSPASGGGTELAPQYIGTSGNFTLTGATVLSFQDWPATIGVDNLKLVTTGTPEPRGYALLLGGLMLAFFRHQAASGLGKVVKLAALCSVYYTRHFLAKEVAFVFGFTPKRSSTSVTFLKRWTVLYSNRERRCSSGRHRQPVVSS